MSTDKGIKENIDAIKLAILNLAAHGVKVECITPAWREELGGKLSIESLRIDTDVS